MTEQRTILILGAGIMQLPAIRAAHRLGLQVFVVDGNAEAPGIAEADRFEHIDLRDRESILDTARQQQQRGGLSAVFTAGTDFSAAVAYVAEELELPGTSLESALNATDKFRMRKVLKSAGIRVPEFTVLQSDNQSERAVDAAVAEVGLPCVVKPADSMGARGVVRADSVIEASALIHEAASHSRTGRVVIEHFIDGPEFSVDALVYADEVLITGFADRHIAFEPFFIEMGHTIPSALDPEAYEQVISEFERGVAALGISSGAAKGDMKLSSAGPVVGEIAARLSGGYMSGWTFPLSSGIELTERAIRIALGEPPGSLTPAWNRTSAERAIISIPGVVESMARTEEAQSAPGVAEVFIKSAHGDIVRLPTSNVEKCGNVIAVSDDRDDACLAAESAVSLVEVVLQPEVHGTERFLFGPDDSRWAFNPEELDPQWLGTVQVGEAAMPDPGSCTLETPLGIGPLPVKAHQRDWSWRTLDESVSRLADEGLVTCDSMEPKLAPCVWRGLLKGGLQGGRYVVRTLKSRSAV